MSNMKTNPSEQLQTIDPAALAQVSGGATSTATTASPDQVMTALTGILESIQSLAGQRDSGGGMNQQEMMMFMMMMQQRNQQQAAAVTATSWWNQEPIVRYY